MLDTKIYFYISESEARNIAVMRMSSLGELVRIQDVALGGKSMPIAISQNQRLLCVGLRSKPYAVQSFAIDECSGTLSACISVPVGAVPVNLAFDKSGCFLFVATNPPNNGEGSKREMGILSVIAISPDGRRQAIDTVVRTPPKLHAALPDPSNHFLFSACCDGDVIVRHELDETTGLNSDTVTQAVTLMQGSGPRHLRFHPNNRFMYLVNEYDAAVHAFNYDLRSGTLSEFQRTTSFPRDFDPVQPRRASDLQFTPDGKWLYVAARGPATIAAFSVNSATGMLTSVGTFPTTTEPRSLCIDPSGRYLFATGERTNNVFSYQIDQATGALTRVADYCMGEGPNWITCAALSLQNA